MKNENFITIQGWMVNQLNLKGNELILYAIIYGFSQDDESEYYGSQRYIAKAMKLSLPTINSLINKLIDKNLILKTGESHYKVLKKLKQGVKETLTVGVKETLTNKYNTNYNNNYNKLASVFTKEIAVDKYGDKYKFLNIQEQYEKFIIYNRDVRKKKLKSEELGFLNWLKKAEEFKAKSPEAISQRERMAEKIKHDDKLLEMERNKATPEEAKKRILEGRALLLKKLSI